MNKIMENLSKKHILTKFLTDANEIVKNLNFEQSDSVKVVVVDSKETGDIYDEYYKKHKCCPSCGSKMLRCTMLGMPSFQPNSYKDINNALCENCGWSGKVDDLIEEKL